MEIETRPYDPLTYMYIEIYIEIAADTPLQCSMYYNSDIT